MLFRNRGLRTKEQQEEFLNPRNPYRLTPKEVGISSVQLIKAAKRIKQAIRKKEKIIVYGDFDADGVCATAIMWEALEKLEAKAMPFIPRREEGYGLKVDRIDEMVKEGVKLIVTVDQGIVHSEQVEHAKKVGIEVIITDHHLPGHKKPKALAILHTTQLSGAGIAWFLTKEMGMKRNLELAAIGTVADISPLVGPNRSLVKFGLKALKKTKRLGLLSLFQFAGIEREKISTYEIGFIIGPRINASGRMDDPMGALRLICTRDKRRANDLAQDIDQKNRERQKLMGQTTLHARNLWLTEDGKSALIFVYHQSYEHGVVGLVANKLKEEFYRPAVVLAPREDYWVASARSIDEFSMIDAIRQLKSSIGEHGGHRLAAGFSVTQDKLEAVKRGLIERAEKELDKSKLSPRLKVDLEVEVADLNLALYQKLEKFAPFGEGNPQPVFASRGLKVFNTRKVGTDGQHLKMKIEGFEAIGFGLSELYARLSPDEPIDVAYNLTLNEWNHQRKLELRLRDIKGLDK